MIRTTIKPLNTDLHITIPKEYVGKELELIVYSIDEGKQPAEVNESEITLFELLKSAPVMTDEDFKKFQEKTKHLNEWK
jgi:hypothetical protein